jgi:hypothetical protein
MLIASIRINTTRLGEAIRAGSLCVGRKDLTAAKPVMQRLRSRCMTGVQIRCFFWPRAWLERDPDSIITKGYTTAAPTAAAPTAGVLPNRPGLPSCRPSHGSYASPSCCPSLGPSCRPGTSDGDMWVQETAPPVPCQKPVRKRTRQGHQPPAGQCTSEGMVVLALRYSCHKDSP